MSFNSFRPSSIAPNARGQSPPSLRNAIEFLPQSSLILDITRTLQILPRDTSSPRRKGRTTESTTTAKARKERPKSISSAAVFRPPLNAASASPRAPPQSPIDTLASVAIANASSGELGGSVSAAQVASNRAQTVFAYPQAEGNAYRVQWHQPPSDLTDERPSKRARSEVLTSPEQFSPPRQYTRPSTSYHTAVESVDAQIADAELLLGFSMASRNGSYSSQASAVQVARNEHPRTGPLLPPLPYGNPAGPLYPRNMSVMMTSPPFHPAIKQEPVNCGSLGRLGNLTVAPPQNSLHEPTQLSREQHITSNSQTRTPPEDRIDQHDVQMSGMEGTQTQMANSAPTGERSGPSEGSSKPFTVPSQPYSPQSLPSELGEVRNLNGKRAVEPPAVDHAANASHAPMPSDERLKDPAGTIGAIFVTPALTTEATEVQAPPNTSPSIPQIDQETKCAGCNFSPNQLVGETVDWLQCNGCKEWFHFACAGVTQKDVKIIDKFFCRKCRPKFGNTTYVRKSARVTNSVDYAGLNEGVLRPSNQNPEHHYIKAIKDGSLKFTPETFPRLPPEEVRRDYFERCLDMCEPIVIPAALNPRPEPKNDDVETAGDSQDWDRFSEPSNMSDYEFEVIADDGQDKLGMIIPSGLTVRRVAELYGPENSIEVIDVKSQEGDSSKKWTVRKWADYYESNVSGQTDIIRNVISLEVSQTPLGQLIRRPKVVREMDLQDNVWPTSDSRRKSVGFYCLMSVADCYTDFHIDFGGSSVYYHIIKGKKVFLFIPPTKQNLQKYQEWCLSPAQNWTFLPHQTSECFRVDLEAGDTMLIPSGWIHAVWTPEHSLVIGGNFLTNLHFGMQFQVNEIEKACKTPPKYRYPFFQKVNWYAVLKYLEVDPLPDTVRQILHEGKQFRREVPINLQFDQWGKNSPEGKELFNQRYYSRAEMDGWPHLLSFIFRTVMIYMDRLEGVSQDARNKVSKSIPKLKGEPLDIARKFAMWVAWKRGNEDVPQWVLSDDVLPAKAENDNKKKLSAAQMKRLERASTVEPRTRRFTTRQATASTAPTQIPTSVQPAASTAAGPTPVLPNGAAPTFTARNSSRGPRQTACDFCRDKKMRCKHRADQPGQSSPPSAKAQPVSNANQNASSMVAVMIHQTPSKRSTVTATQVSPPARPSTANGPDSPSRRASRDTPNGKKSRTRACSHCRKHKRRCVHNEFGDVDPIKASEISLPRGGRIQKRPHSLDSAESMSLSKRIKKEQPNNSTFTLSDDMIDPELLPLAYIHPDPKGDGNRPIDLRQKSEGAAEATLAASGRSRTGRAQSLGNIYSTTIGSMTQGVQSVDARAAGPANDGVQDEVCLVAEPVAQLIVPPSGEALRSTMVYRTTTPPSHLAETPHVINGTTPQANGAPSTSRSRSSRSAAPSMTSLTSKRMTPKTAKPKSMSPDAGSSAAQRRGSTVKVSPTTELGSSSKKARSGSVGDHSSPVDDEEASLQLALKLAAEERGLRPRRGG